MNAYRRDTIHDEPWGEPEPGWDDQWEWVRPMSDLNELDEKTIAALAKLSKKLQPERHKALEKSLRDLEKLTKESASGL